MPFFTAFLIHVAATGWFDDRDWRRSAARPRPASRPSPGWTPRPSRCLRAAPRRSTRGTAACSGRRCCVPKPVRTSFWNRYASSLLPLAEPKPASALGPCVSRMRAQRAAGQRQRLVPASPRGRPTADSAGSTVKSADLRHARLADQRLRQPLRVADVVEAEAALDAQPLVIGGAVAPFDVHDLVVLDVVRDLAADAAIRAHRRDLAVDRLQERVVRRRERAGRARLHAFAACDARGERPSDRRDRTRSSNATPRNA